MSWCQRVLVNHRRRNLRPSHIHYHRQSHRLQPCSRHHRTHHPISPRPSLRHRSKYHQSHLKHCRLIRLNQLRSHPSRILNIARPHPGLIRSLAHRSHSDRRRIHRHRRLHPNRHQRHHRSRQQRRHRHHPYSRMRIMTTTRITSSVRMLSWFFGMRMIQCINSSHRLPPSLVRRLVVQCNMFNRRLPLTMRPR